VGKSVNYNFNSKKKDIMNKVTQELIESKIANENYMKLSSKLTHCILTMENGFEITGESACVDPANYDPVLGQRIAYKNAFDKIWMLEGYLLQEKLKLKKEYELRNPSSTIHPEEALKISVIGPIVDNEVKRGIFGI
jgi:hypothetical protein